jgi:hypothetical protein
MESCNDEFQSRIRLIAELVWGAIFRIIITIILSAFGLVEKANYRIEYALYSPVK